ncbi:proton-conducting transporter membrane subunit [Devosia nitrariae]|uniref:Cation:proton antiporter n=1 Tax=Devosia nitrariae TaxID=2071872 RepID=A0ABQ5W583_9HYPH|nr:proton-conducting transporter membrane subunit [Devosia nitrariae]GLQ55024.1 cation:proton antiporter [Devosia nitrariae]
METEANLPQAMIETATAAADWVIVLPMALALMGAALLLMARRTRSFHAGFALLVVAAIIACEATLFVRVMADGPVSMTMGRWLPPFGISFTADLFGTAFALTSAAVTFVVIFYMQMDHSAGDNRDGQFAMVLLLLAGVTGSFLTGDFFNMYVWFEVMLIASFGLVVLGGRGLQLDGAVKYGFLNFLATTFFLLALGLTYALLGTLNMADIIGKAEQADPAALAGIAALLVLAFGMKAAAFPVNAWLPASYHTPPAAVSALFAGLLTKVGIFALMRAMVMLFPSSRDLLEPVLAAAAIATLVIAPLGAIAETNLRRAMGFIVIGGIGVVLSGIAIPTPSGVAGSGFYIFHAILTMAALYLVAGLVEKVTGETDSRRMGGIYAANSPLSILFFVVVLAAAGVPPFLGFWPKLLLIEAGLERTDLRVAGGPADWTGLAMAGALIVNAWLTLIAGTRLWAHIFWRAGSEGAQSEYQPVAVRALSVREGWLGWGATAVLVGAIVAAGLWPDFAFQTARAAAADFIDPSRYVAAVGLATGSGAP